MVEISYKCKSDEASELIRSFMEERFGDKADVISDGYVCIQENYSDTIGFVEDAEELALKMIEKSPETTFSIYGRTITDHSNMEFSVDYDGITCVSYSTDWYWEIWSDEYEDFDDFYESAVRDSHDDAFIENLRRMYDEAEASGEPLYKADSEDVFWNDEPEYTTSRTIYPEATEDEDEEEE